MLDPSDGTSPVLARADSDVSTSSSASSDSVFSSFTSSDRRSSTASSIHPHSWSSKNDVAGGASSSSSELDTPIAELPRELHTERSDIDNFATSTTPNSSLNGLQQAIRSLTITPSLSAEDAGLPSSSKGYATPPAAMKVQSNRATTPTTASKHHHQPKTASSGGDGFPWNRANSSKSACSSSVRRGSRTVQDDTSIVSTPSAIFNSGYTDFPTPSSSKLQASPTRRADDVKGYRATIDASNSMEEQQRYESSGDGYTTLKSTPLAKSTSAGPSSPRLYSSGSSSANYKDSISAYHQQQQQQQLSMAALATLSATSNNFNPFRYSPPALGGSSAIQSTPASPVASLQDQSAKHSSPSTGLSTPQEASMPMSQRSRNFSMESASRSSTVYPCSQPPSSSGSTRPWVRDADASSVRSCGTASEGSEQEGAQGETLSVMSPVAPPQIPFLASNSAPATGCRICVDASHSDHFVVVATLPGFSLDNITLALKRNGALHILADRYDQSCASSCPSLVSSSPSSANSGRASSTGASSVTSGESSASSICSTHSAAHFERLVELGEQAIGSKVTAEFDGKRLRMTVQKRNTSSRSSFKSSSGAMGGKSDSSHTSSSRNHLGSSGFSIF